MARFTVSCFLLTIATYGLGLIYGLEPAWTNFDEFPTSTGTFPTGTNNLSDFGPVDTNAVGTNQVSEMSRMMEDHLLRMLKLSARPTAVTAEPVVPGYIRALQHAVDSLPPSAATLDGNDDLTWAVKATQGILLKMFSD